MNSTTQIDLISEEQIPVAGEVLARAFFDDPLCVYTEPDPAARMSGFASLFTDLVRECARRNGVYTSSTHGQPHGVAVWAPPQNGEPISEAASDEPDGMTQGLGSEASSRFYQVYRHFEHIHHQVMTGPHWFLALLGVPPHCQEQGIGTGLLTPVLRQADREGLPCYLGTFVPANVLFYEHRGFQIVETGIEPQSRIPFWAMRREPQALLPERHVSRPYGASMNGLHPLEAV